LVGEDDVIAGLHGFHAFADFLYDAGAFMAQHDGRIVPAIHVVYICMANAGSYQVHQDFVFPRTLELKGFDFQGAALGAQNGGLNLVHVFFDWVRQNLFLGLLVCFQTWVILVISPLTDKSSEITTPQ
jgi:hypothetical protein